MSLQTDVASGSHGNRRDRDPRRGARLVTAKNCATVKNLFPPRAAAPLVALALRIGAPACGSSGGGAGGTGGSPVDVGGPGVRAGATTTVTVRCRVIETSGRLWVGNSAGEEIIGFSPRQLGAIGSPASDRSTGIRVGSPSIGPATCGSSLARG